MAQNTDDFLRSLGFVIAAHEPGQTVRSCTGISYHCQDIATAVDYGTVQYGAGVLWAMFDALAPYAYGSGRIVEELAFANRAIDGGGDVGAWPDHYDHLHTALVPGRLLPITRPAPPAPKRNPIASGMLLQDLDSGAVYLVGAGHLHHVPTWEEVDRLKFIGAPLVQVRGLEVVGWARTLGVPGWDLTETYQ